MDVLIVGAGVFGQVIAARLREENHKVLVIDRREPLAGSPASGGHLKPSWLTALPKAEMEASFETLDRLYGLETLECRFGFKTIEIQRLDIDKVLYHAPVVEADVSAVGDGFADFNTSTGHTLFKGVVIVAAGIWSAELLPQFAHLIHGKRGMSFIFNTKSPVVNIIKLWAPYKQIVRTSHGPGKVWIGDGTAIKPDNWNEARETAIRSRLDPYFPKVYDSYRVQRGIRPYMADGLRQVGKRLWLATGGGKSGTALAGVYANKLAEALR